MNQMDLRLNPILRVNKKNSNTIQIGLSLIEHSNGNGNLCARGWCLCVHFLCFGFMLKKFTNKFATRTRMYGNEYGINGSK